MPDHYRHPRPMAQDQTRVVPGPREPSPLQRYLRWRAQEAQRVRNRLGYQDAPEHLGTTMRGLLSRLPGSEHVPDQAADVGEGLLNFLLGSGHPGEFVEGPAAAAVPLLARLRRMLVRQGPDDAPVRRVIDIVESAAKREGRGIKPGTAEQIAEDNKRTLDIATRIANRNR